MLTGVGKYGKPFPLGQYSGVGKTKKPTNELQTTFFGEEPNCFFKVAGCGGQLVDASTMPTQNNK